MYRLNDQRAALEALVREHRTGVSADTATARAARMDAAREALSVRPFILTVPLSGAVAARNTVVFDADEPRRRTILTSWLTDMHVASALFNVYRRGNKSSSLLTRPQQALFFMGDMGADNNRIAPSDPFYSPEPYPVEEGELINVSVTGDKDTLSTDLTNTFVCARGIQVIPDGSYEAQFSDAQLKEIQGQIAGTRQELRIAFATIDYTDPIGDGSGFTDVPVDAMEDWCLLLGIITTLRHSMFQINDLTRPHEWTNNRDGIPSTALANYLGYRDKRVNGAGLTASLITGAVTGTANLIGGVPGTNTEQLRGFTHPYLVPPRKKPFEITAAKRAAATASGDNITEDDEGVIAFVYRTV